MINWNNGITEVTYAELAEAKGIKVGSARKWVQRHKWKTFRYGKNRKVMVPTEELEPIIMMQQPEQEVTLIKIDKHVPLPEPRGGTHWPLDGLEVGDSFAIASRDRRIGGLQQQIYLSQKKTGRKYTTRKQGGEFRVWRVS